jgi:hypothetical protein
MAIELNALDVSVLEAGYRTLARYNPVGSPRVRAGNFAVATAVLLARRKGYGPTWPIQISQIGQGAGVTTGELQNEICDRAWRKLSAFLPPGAEGPIHKPFTNSFKPESASGSNNWRNSFDLQAGLGCDAPPTAEFLLDDRYLSEERFYCQYRNQSGQCTSPAGRPLANRTCFNPSKHPSPPAPGTAALRCPKFLARGSEAGHTAYWHVEPTVDVLGQLIGNPAARVPIYAFIAALYGGSAALLGGTPTVTLDRFQDEIALTNQALGTMFDADPNSQFNRDFCSELSGAVHDQTATATATATTAANAAVAVTVPVVSLVAQPKGFQFGRQPSVFRQASKEYADPAQRIAALEKANQGHSITLERTATIFEGAGYSLQEDISSFDLLCTKGTLNYLVEVKTWTNSNIRDQIRRAISQLAEYEWKLEAIGVHNPYKLIMLDQQPPSYMIPYLRDFVSGFLGILTCWVHGDAIRTISPAQLQI